MIFRGFKKKEEGKYITRYDLYYETTDHKPKTYEMISRNKNLQSFEELYGSRADAVVIIVFNEDGTKILLNKEYRMACGGFVYNFPAGLIDQGESVEEASKRELKEETGLDLIEIEDVMGVSFSAVGFSNEKNRCIVGKASGIIQPSNSTVEEIEASWYSKEELKELLKKEAFAARTQAFCYMWANH